MISYVKEYGITNLDYEYIINNLNQSVVELMTVNEISIRKVLSYYNEMGITSDLSKIIVLRPDLIITTVDALKSLYENIDPFMLKNVVAKSCEDLILLGI